MGYHAAMIAAVIRAATTDEARAVAELFLAVRHAMEHVAPTVHSDEETRLWMRETLFRETEVTVAVMDGAIAAMMASRPGWIDQLHVHPDFQNRGLGAALLRAAKASDHGAAGLQLWTFQANAGARRFYARHGFVEVEWTDGQGNEEKTPDVRLEWAFQPEPLQ